MKHAVIIAAHDNVEVVRTSIRMMDDPNFVFFLHIDKKSRLNPNLFIPALEHATCQIIE